MCPNACQQHYKVLNYLYGKMGIYNAEVIWNAYLVDKLKHECTPFPVMLNSRVTCCLIHWGRVTHICVSKLNIIDSDNGFSPGRCQVIVWTNAWMVLIGTLGINFGQILIEIDTSSFEKIHLKMPSAKRRPLCLGLNVLTKTSLLN